MNLRQKERSNKHNKELVKFFNHTSKSKHDSNSSYNVKSKRSIQNKPKIHTRVSSGGGVIFSPKNDLHHFSQNNKIQ